jgi:hypothetical protein
MKKLTDHTYRDLIDTRNKLELIVFNCKTVEEVESKYIQRKLRQLLTIGSLVLNVQRAMYRKFFFLH